MISHFFFLNKMTKHKILFYLEILGFTLSQAGEVSQRYPKNQINIDTFLWRKTSGKSSVWSGELASTASGAGPRQERRFGQTACDCVQRPVPILL